QSIRLAARQLGRRVTLRTAQVVGGAVEITAKPDVAVVRISVQMSESFLIESKFLWFYIHGFRPSFSCGAGLPGSPGFLMCPPADNVSGAERGILDRLGER